MPNHGCPSAWDAGVWVPVPMPGFVLPCSSAAPGLGRIPCALVYGAMPSIVYHNYRPFPKFKFSELHNANTLLQRLAVALAPWAKAAAHGAAGSVASSSAAWPELSPRLSLWPARVAGCWQGHMALMPGRGQRQQAHPSLILANMGTHQYAPTWPSCREQVYSVYNVGSSTEFYSVLPNSAAEQTHPSAWANAIHRCRIHPSDFFPRQV
ncbi:hypothetical protein CDD82_1844 [Ophiocordyceps australis]|uniref:Uncharacterized protein n=1 Tax=Ophiocordyceps australis TaxID=1399860 RepID=A0A2C5ZJX4_9HYPO|nr:hypothetical protein CDD82_1844 [Ophiocordyceps australis]